ncbi:hypothetical protein T440DRAFT_318673 [Plenodomus tracheiphilus IPT5]|uniref:Heterokaryon incompatibility domain-containing protein n=1 Tax=Plenodomus tracheiphilus IPT5 TaxID=1408161 RepID=A0A6A7BCW0_9PLEO|nr:hypothetical protein T440DRAFT_318673 [Plenodomus tracheiphilus IPT5]
MYFHMAHSGSPPYFSRFGQCEFLDIDGDELNISSLQVRLVESPTREALLRKRTPWSDLENQSDSTTLLSDLNRLAPSLAKDIVSKDLVDNAFPFRLINDVDHQGEEEGYIAMSYCWKRVAPNTPRRVVTPVGDLPFGWTKEIEQFPLPTSPAIFQAILQERESGEGLWYDQVSINQDDDVEKAATIGSIDTIFKNARTVVVSLDDICITDSEEQFLQYYVEPYSHSGLPSYQQPHSGIEPPFMQQNSAFRSFCERILSSEWFDRAWCAHEMRMGHNHIFLVPCSENLEDEVSTIFRFTGEFLYHILVLASELADLTPAVRLRLQSLLEILQRKPKAAEHDALAVQRYDEQQTLIPDERSLTSLIVDTFSMKASGNPSLPEHLRQLDANRDKTCIALNASGLPLAMAPRNAFSRPDIEDECLRSLLLVALASRDPASLCSTGPPLRLHDGSVSWLCRPTSLDNHARRPSPRRINKLASTITQATDGRAEYAQLDLVFLDLPHRAQPNPNFPLLVTRARRFIDVCIQYQIPGSGLWSFSRSSNHPRTLTLRNCFIQALSCIFDCGVQWLLEISSNMQLPDCPVMDAYTIDVLLNPHLIVENYVLLEEGQLALSQLLTFISALIASGIPWASGASESTHGPLIVSASTPSWSHNYPNTHLSSSSSSGNGIALIFAPFEHSRTLLVAVPNAIKNTAYNGLARGWILTSMNPFTGNPKTSVSWTLQSKGVVFGNVRFHAALEGCGEADVRNHRVYGPSVVR